MGKTSTQAAIIEIEGKKAEKPGQRIWAFYFKAKKMKTLQASGIDYKDFRPAQLGKSKPKSSAMNTLRQLLPAGADPFGSLAV
jgi:hypothetical protein